MKHFGLKFAIIILALVLVSFLLTFQVLSCSVAFAEDTTPLPSVKAIVAPCSNLLDNEYAQKSTLKVSVVAENIEIYLPESYYLTNPTVFDNKYYMVEYCGKKFFYESSEDISQDVALGDVNEAYPDVRLTLINNATVTIDSTSITSEHTIKFMGYNEDSSEIYVSATLDGNTVYGFIDKQNLVDFNVPYHKIAQEERDRMLAELIEPTPDNGDITPTSSLALRIVLIIGIAVPAVIIAILLFKPTKNARRVVDRRRYQDDIDYDEPRRRDNRDDRDYYDDRDRYRDDRR